MIHQALHGYQDGHRLLASSCPLPTAAERQILILSDLSGPGFQPSFDAYLTGYPLTEVSYYALARTWYAAEMERPGCVFTHTLLIKIADLGGLRDPRIVLSLFHRPQDIAEREAYTRPISIDLVDTPDAAPRLPAPLPAIAGPLLEALYTPPMTPTILCATGAAEYEELLLWLFMQQWPRLRRSFRFCTGSLSARTQGEHPFALQMAPARVVRAMRREWPGARVIEPPPSAPGPLHPWTQALLDDLSDHDSAPVSRLRSFLWTFGADVLRPQESMSALCSIYLLLRSSAGNPDMNVLLGLIQRSFPDPQDAGHLKRTFFGPAPRGVGWLTGDWPEPEILSALANSPTEGAFDPATLDLAGRARQLMLQDRRLSMDLVGRLSRDSCNESGAALLDGLASALQPADIPALRALTLDRSLLPMLVRRNTALATSIALWQGPAAEQRELLDALSRGDLSASGAAIVRTLLSAGSDAVAEDALRLLGKAGVAAALDWLNEQERPSVGPGWLRALGHAQDQVMEWLAGQEAPRPGVSLLLTRILDPASFLVCSRPSSFWVERLLPQVRRSSEPQGIGVAAFLLVLGFSQQSPQGIELIRPTFSKVHEAARWSSLSYEDWRRLEGSLCSTPIEWWKEWDRCERLRRGLIHALVTRKWGGILLSMAIEEDDIFEKILNSCENVAGGTGLLLDLHRAVRQGDLSLSSRRLDILTRVVR